MKVYRNAGRFGAIKGAVLTLGNFDGLHLGHRKILMAVRRRADALKAPAVVYTFDPHPLKVVAPSACPPLILDAPRKARLMEAEGMDAVVFARFTREFAARHPREFVEEVLVKSLAAKEVWVGHDFSFGRGKSGTVEYLKGLGEELGFRVVVIPAYRRGGEVVSSSRIRSLISAGKVAAAARLLGRRHSVVGRVVRGRDIGKALGFPTANINVKSELVPADGVYAAYAVLRGKRMKAVVNIGTAPTFKRRKRCVEAHIFGFKEDIYGMTLEVEFVGRIRGERAFVTPDSLKKRIRKDALAAKRALAGKEVVRKGRG